MPGELKAASEILPAAGDILDFLSGKNRKERNWQSEQNYLNMMEQWGMSQAQDILSANTRQEQLNYLTQNLQQYTPYKFSAPNEPVYRQTAELGLENIREQGMRNLMGQQEAMGARGLGESSIGIGADQRLGQRTMREMAGLEAEYAQQAAQRQAQFEQLQAAEQYRTTQASNELAQLKSQYLGDSEEDIREIYREFKPKKAEEEYSILEKILPGGKGKKGTWGGKWKLKI